MVSTNPSHILALIRSGHPIEVGRGVRDGKRRAGPTALQLTLGFGAIYLIWGSTYLGIRYAVETIPPLLMMGIRHSVAGLLVYTWARRTGVPAPEWRQWRFAAIAGALLFLGGHGLLAWAEQKVPSGLAALLCATLPLWTVLLAYADGTERKLGVKAWMGILLGFVGVAVLISPDTLTQHLDLLAAAGAMASALVWVMGTAYTRRVVMPASKILSASMQMMSGGALLLMVGALSGETRHVQLANLTIRSVAALAYLIVFGSIVAFTVYTWLVSVSSPSRLSTYAYVNPAIAVFLGWAVAGEPLGMRTIAATAIIVAGVVLVTTRRKQPASEVVPTTVSRREAWEAGD